MNKDKIIIASISIILILVVASPVLENWKDEPKDSFPLSYYPMFTKARGEKTIVWYLYGEDKDRYSYTISNNFVIPGVGFNTARKQIRRMIQNNQSAELCESTAKTIGRIGMEPYNKITYVAVVSSRVDISEFMKKRNNYRPRDNRIYANCLVDSTLR